MSLCGHTRRWDLKCGNSQHGNVESVAKKTDKQLQPRMLSQQQAAHSGSVPYQTNVSLGFIPPFFICGIYASTFPCCLPTLSTSLLGLKLCKSSTFPSSPAVSPLCFFCWVYFNPWGMPAETPEGFCFCSPFFVRVGQKHIKSRKKKFVSLYIRSVSQQTGRASPKSEPVSVAALSEHLDACADSGSRTEAWTVRERGREKEKGDQEKIWKDGEQPSTAQFVV